MKLETERKKEIQSWRSSPNDQLSLLQKPSKKNYKKKQGWYCCPPSFKSCSAISPPLCFASFQLSDNSFAFILGTPKQNKSYVSLFLENINPLTGQKLFLLHVGQFSVPSLNFQLLYDSLMLPSVCGCAPFSAALSWILTSAGLMWGVCSTEGFM